MRTQPSVLLLLLIPGFLFAAPLLSSAVHASDCLTTDCQTYYYLNTQGSISGVTYTWSNTNPCGTFLPNTSVQATPQEGVALWQYGPGVGSACTNLNGTVTVVITSSGGSVTCTDPNGASGSDFNVAGPAGLTSCSPNPPPRSLGFTVNDFGAQQSVTGVSSQSSSSSTTPASASASQTTTTSGGPSGPSLLLPAIIISALAILGVAFVTRTGVPPPPPPDEVVPVTGTDAVTPTEPVLEIKGTDTPGPPQQYMRLGAVPLDISDKRITELKAEIAKLETTDQPMRPDEVVGWLFEFLGVGPTGSWSAQRAADDRWDILHRALLDEEAKLAKFGGGVPSLPPANDDVQAIVGELDTTTVL